MDNVENATATQSPQVDEAQLHHIQGVIEALLFTSEKAVTLEQIKNVLEAVSLEDIHQAIQGLQKIYEDRQSGITIMEIAGGYQMLSNSKYANYIRTFYKTKHKEKLSKPALETLAIVAYKQPVTRADIEVIRGVNSDGVVISLIEKELLKIVGRKDIAGRPFLYGTTKQFLEYFGLKSLAGLPKLEDFKKLKPVGEEEDKESSGNSSQQEVTKHES
jgi:segregation and condensation protein B